MTASDTEGAASDDGSLRDILIRLTTLAEQGPAQPVDPTANVTQLVKAANRRQDDLRLASERRRNDLDRQEHSHRKELRKVEQRYSNAERVAEARRLDAIIAGQTAAAALDRISTQATASALAERVETSAKTLAASVQASATTLATGQDATTQALIKRIEPLEQFLYRQGGVKEQAGESRDRSQWTTERIMALLALAFAALVWYTSQPR